MYRHLLYETKLVKCSYNRVIRTKIVVYPYKIYDITTPIIFCLAKVITTNAIRVPTRLIVASL